jgi:hypothetical protein
MSTVPPLTMSQTKDELLRHLNMSPETYALMAKETSRVYKWLTKDPVHLKKNCKRQPPYDWSDIQEKAKDQAMLHIVESGDECTRYYWNLAKPTPDCPNWIAKWFLCTSRLLCSPVAQIFQAEPSELSLKSSSSCIEFRIQRLTPRSQNVHSKPSLTSHRP